jgi:hypothetical protein
MKEKIKADFEKQLAEATKKIPELIEPGARRVLWRFYLLGVMEAHTHCTTNLKAMDIAMTELLLDEVRGVLGR